MYVFEGIRYIFCIRFMRIYLSFFLPGFPFGCFFLGSMGFVGSFTLPVSCQVFGGKEKYRQRILLLLKDLIDTW